MSVKRRSETVCQVTTAVPVDSRAVMAVRRPSQAVKLPSPSVRSAVLRSDGLYVYCDNITDASYVFLNGKPFGETQRIDQDTLFVAGDDAEPGDVVSIVQMGNDGEPLSYTNEYLLN